MWKEETGGRGDKGTGRQGDKGRDQMSEPETLKSDGAASPGAPPSTGPGAASPAPSALPAVATPGVEFKAPVTRDMVFEALKPIEDPEIHLGIVDLGLVYGADVAKEGKEVTVSMTLTSPACPYGPMLIDQVRKISRGLPGVERAEVLVVWEPPWDPRTMAADHVKDVLGIW